MLNHSNQQKFSWGIDLFFLTLTIGLLFCIFLGERPLFVPDEGRYAEIAREMVATHDYVTPYLNGIKYFEKPILFYWLSAIAIKLGGLNLWAIRSVNTLLGLLGCLLTYCTARKLYGRTTGLLAAWILSTSALYFVMTHMISLDLPITFFLSTCLYSFLLGSQEPPGRKRRWYFWLAAAFAAFAVLDKGLIGVVFPALIVMTWIVLLGEWRQLKHLYLPSSLFIFFIIAAPWHIIVGLRNPEFYYFYFVEQHFLRYTTPDVGHVGPFWFFIPALILGFFPWIVFLPQALKANFSWKLRKQYQTELFFILWAALVFFFFSFSKSKLIPYILPIFPALAVLTARYLSQGLQQKFRLGIRIGFIVLVVFAIAITYQLYLFTHYTLLPDQKTAKMLFYTVTLILLAGTCFSGVYAARHLRIALTSIFLTTGIFLLVVLAAVPAIDYRSVRPLTNVLKPILKPSDDVVTYNQYYQDLPFYLERRISILNWRNELSYGMQYQDTRDWMIDDNTFWQRWDSDRRIFVLISRNELEKLQNSHPNKHFYFISQTNSTALISNQR